MDFKTGILFYSPGRRFLSLLIKVYIWPNLCKFELADESWRHHNLERTHDWCSAVGKVAFDNYFINPGLFL